MQHADFQADAGWRRGAVKPVRDHTARRWLVGAARSLMLCFLLAGCGGTTSGPGARDGDPSEAGAAAKGVVVGRGAASADADAENIGAVGVGTRITGLDFPGSAAVNSTMRFRFRSPLARYPATYILRVFPRRQSGYYTAFFWGNDDDVGRLSTFLWTSGGGADSYYGAHPYPNPPPAGRNHRWEISIEQHDYQNGDVVYDRWYTQALVVWQDAQGRKHHEFYWDLPHVDAAHRVSHTSPASYGNAEPPQPALTFGDAPWAPGNEVWNGILRGFQVYADALSITDVMAEVASPGSTATGAASLWYLNLNPTPSDIRDHSGRGHDPTWVGGERPALWVGP